MSPPLRRHSEHSCHELRPRTFLTLRRAHLYIQNDCKGNWLGFAPTSLFPGPDSCAPRGCRQRGQALASGRPSWTGAPPPAPAPTPRPPTPDTGCPGRRGSQAALGPGPGSACAPVRRRRRREGRVGLRGPRVLLFPTRLELPATWDPLRNFSCSCHDTRSHLTPSPTPGSGPGCDILQDPLSGRRGAWLRGVGGGSAGGSAQSCPQGAGPKVRF